MDVNGQKSAIQLRNEKDSTSAANKTGHAERTILKKHAKPTGWQRTKNLRTYKSDDLSWKKEGSTSL